MLLHGFVMSVSSFTIVLSSSPEHPGLKVSYQVVSATSSQPTTGGKNMFHIKTCNAGEVNRRGQDT